MTPAAADPEDWLSGLDKIGWRFGLERIRRVCELLGLPQNRYGSLHVVGSNGKTSVALITAALLREHGLATGAYVSPHVERWSERIRIGEGVIDPRAFATAAEEVARAAAVAERSFEPGERVTQFEAATATAFVALARARVDAAVIEAGLGGRLDATNVIPSRVTALASVSLEHTDYLGDTEEEIAGEKLAVLRPHSTLVLGVVSEPVARLAAAVAGERGAALVRADDLAEEVPAGVRGAYQRRNFAVALGAAGAFLDRPLDREAIARSAAAARLPARLELVEGEPPLLLDAAHNPGGMEAAVEALPELTGGRPVIALVAALDDKPAAGLCAPLAGACELVVCTEIPADAFEGAGRPGARSHRAAELAAACGRAGGRAEAIPDPAAGLARAREVAGERGAVVLAVGSFFLYAALRRS